MDLSSEVPECYCCLGGLAWGGRGGVCFSTQLHIGLEFKTNYIVAISENNTY